MLFKRFLQRSAPTGAKNKNGGMEPEQLVSLVQEGDELIREQMIVDYQPYILKVTSSFSKRFIDPSKDDEFSIALLAFNEAINQFDSQAGKSFLGFAENVIRRRLIDYVRKEQRHKLSIPYSTLEPETDEPTLFHKLETKRALSAFDESRVNEERRNEISELNEELSKYGISFLELVDHSPKHADSRQLLMGIAKALVSEEQLMGTLLQSGKLPIKELILLCGVSRKTIERNRKYIITIALIMSGLYPFLKEYIGHHFEEERMEQEVNK